MSVELSNPGKEEVFEVTLNGRTVKITDRLSLIRFLRANRGNDKVEILFPSGNKLTATKLPANCLRKSVPL